MPVSKKSSSTKSAAAKAKKAASTKRPAKAAAKAAPKKPQAAKKAAAAKPAADKKKAVVKKAAAKPAASKKKAVVKKAPAKTSAKKAPAKKKAPATKVAPKKAAQKTSKKAAAAKPVSKKTKPVPKKAAPKKKAGATAKTAAKTKTPKVTSAAAPKAPSGKPRVKATRAKKTVAEPVEIPPRSDAEIKKQSAKAFSASFFKKQRVRLLNLKDLLLDSMNGVAKDTLRSRAEGSEGNAFGMHQADAGSDAYDRDFALSLLSQEQNSLYEIDEALKRLEEGTYGICQMSEVPIPKERLEALPFTRFTVQCQAELEKANRFQARAPVTSLFGVGDDDSDGDDDDSGSDN